MSYFKLVSNNGWICQARVYPLVGKVCRHQRPFCIKLNCLCLGQIGQELSAPGSWSEKWVNLEGNHRTWVETKCSCMLSKISQNIAGVEESNLIKTYYTIVLSTQLSNHGDPGCNIYRIYIIAEYKRTAAERLIKIFSSTQQGGQLEVRHRLFSRPIYIQILILTFSGDIWSKFAMGWTDKLARAWKYSRFF